jgi:starvation-inducible outer membrane lipoprotein
MLKTITILTGVFLLAGCEHVPYNPNRPSTGSHTNCSKLKQDLNLNFHRHVVGNNFGKSVSASQRASEMQLYERDCK